MADTAALAAVPDGDDDMQLDVQELLEAHSRIASEQIAGLLMRVASLEASLSALRRQLPKRKG